MLDECKKECGEARGRMGNHPVIMGQVGTEVTDIGSVPCLGPQSVQCPCHLTSYPLLVAAPATGALQAGTHPCPKAFAFTPLSQESPPP